MDYTWYLLDRYINEEVNTFNLLCEVNELALKYHETKSITVAAELANKYYLILKAEGYAPINIEVDNEKSQH